MKNNIQSLKNDEIVKGYRRQLEMNHQNNQIKDCKTPTTVNQKRQSIKTAIRSATDTTLSKGMKELKKFWVNTKVIHRIGEKRK